MVDRRRLRALCSGIDRLLAAVDHVIVERVLYVSSTRVGALEEPVGVGFVVGEEPLAPACDLRPASASKAESTQRRVIGHHRILARGRQSRRLTEQPSCVQPQIQVLRNHSVGSRCELRLVRARD